MEIPTIYEIKQLIIQLSNPEEIIRTGGLIIILVIVFSETGLFFGFFLPGDSLLFTAGLMTAMKVINQHILTVLVLIIISAVLGDLTGYWFGRKTGYKIFSRKESILYKKEYLQRAKLFYDRYGNLAIILGHFIPIIRTFAPIVAGVVQLDFGKYSRYNLLGAFIWASSLILSGFFFGILFPEIIKYLELIIILLIILSGIPLFRGYMAHKKGKWFK